LFFTCSLQI